MKRTLDAQFLNAVANHPEVRPWLGGQGVLDLTSALENPANVAMVGEGGGFVFNQWEPGLYEAHSLFLPEARGAQAQAAMWAAVQYLFTATDCVKLLTRVPADNKAALGLTRTAGFHAVFEHKDGWRSGDKRCDVTHFALLIERWIARAPGLVEHGEAFHEALEAAKAARGSALPTHPHDEAHERTVGAAMLMAMAGNAAKAVRTYNAWARLTGYDAIALIGTAPAIIDVRDAIIEVRDGGMEVVKCR